MVLGLERFKSVKPALILLGILIILTAALSFVYLNRGNLLLFGLEQTLSSLQQKSTAEVFLEGNKIKARFNIGPKDKPSALAFSQNLGIGDGWMSGVSATLDDQSLEKLSKILPVKLNLKFSGEGASFETLGLPSLESGLSKSEYNFATESGRLTLKTQDNNDFSLEVSDPGPLLNYATVSGQFRASAKVVEMVPILSKMAKIEVRVNGKNVRGEVKLK